MHLKFVLAPSLQLVSFMSSGELFLNAKNSAFCAYFILYINNMYGQKFNNVAVVTLESKTRNPSSGSNCLKTFAQTNLGKLTCFTCL